MSEAKPFEIPRMLIWEAWQDVRANRGAAGVDEESIQDFEENLKQNLYKIWNRMASGSYFPPPVKRVSIPKRGGGERHLGVPTVADCVAQAAVKRVLEPLVEPHFHPDSYGYRPGKSAHDAVAQARQRCWSYLLRRGWYDCHCQGKSRSRYHGTRGLTAAALTISIMSLISSRKMTPRQSISDYSLGVERHVFTLDA